MPLRKIILSLLIGLLARPMTSHAQTPGLLNSTEEDIYRSRISEYFYMRSNRDVLKPVRVLGSVKTPGLYHIPPNTTLTNLLAISGGPSDEADSSRITIARKDGSVEKRDLMKLVTKNQDLTLVEGDTIYVPKEETLISSKNSTVILTITTIISVGLTSYVVFRK